MSYKKYVLFGQENMSQARAEQDEEV
uniref:Uncharacterized protein n=1 Tax=Pithovirus LCPAC304 TaxID=2506594 RepID=A0A481Z9V0_9VIRU|nr:MAG: hypothetical protein LCPAC304_04890 [Pithovirus LCPAC304]